MFKNIQTKKIIDGIKWRESKRCGFNLLVGFSGMLGVVKGVYVATENIFIISDMFGIILANILYSSGILVEIFDNYYFNSKLKMESIGCIYAYFWFGFIILSFFNGKNNYPTVTDQHLKSVDFLCQNLSKRILINL